VYKTFLVIHQDEDPDMLVGYETQQSSWGFLVKRSANKYNLNLPPLLSRLPEGQYESRFMSSSKSDKYVKIIILLLIT
jgi:hypothetical protein